MKVMFFKIAEKETNNLGNFCLKFCCKELLPNLVTLLPLLETFNGLKMLYYLVVGHFLLLSQKLPNSRQKQYLVFRRQNTKYYEGSSVTRLQCP